MPIFRNKGSAASAIRLFKKLQNDAPISNSRPIVSSTINQSTGEDSDANRVTSLSVNVGTYAAEAGDLEIRFDPTLVDITPTSPSPPDTRFTIEVYSILSVASLPVSDQRDRTIYHDQSDDSFNIWHSAAWVTIGGGGSGAVDFTDLADVPSSYSGAAGQFTVVNSGATGLEFIPYPGVLYVDSGDSTADYLDQKLLASSTIEFATAALPGGHTYHPSVKSDSLTEAHLAADNSPSDGDVLSWNSTDDLNWVPNDSGLFIKGRMSNAALIVSSSYSTILTLPAQGSNFWQVDDVIQKFAWGTIRRDNTSRNHTWEILFGATQVLVTNALSNGSTTAYEPWHWDIRMIVDTLSGATSRVMFHARLLVGSTFLRFNTDESFQHDITANEAITLRVKWDSIVTNGIKPCGGYAGYFR